MSERPYRYLLRSWTERYPHSASMVFSKRASAEIAFNDLLKSRQFDQTVQLKDTQTGHVLAQEPPRGGSPA